jgi:hypothetical protein
VCSDTGAAQRRWLNPEPSNSYSFQAGAINWHAAIEREGLADAPLCLETEFGKADQREYPELIRAIDDPTISAASRDAALSWMLPPKPLGCEIPIADPDERPSAKAKREPVAREPPPHANWAEHLCYALKTKPVSALRARTLTEIAGKKVPSRIDRQVTKMIAHDVTLGQPGRVGQKSVSTMRTILMSDDATQCALADFRSRMRPRPPLNAIREHLAFCRRWKPNASGQAAHHRQTLGGHLLMAA